MGWSITGFPTSRDTSHVRRGHVLYGREDQEINVGRHGKALQVDIC